MSTIVNEAANATDSLIGIPYPIIQIVLSILIPLVVFYLGLKATIKGFKKKELSRLLVLKDYYYLWVKDIVKDATKQNINYKEYIVGLYKLDFLSGLPYKGIEITFNKIKAIDDKDLYRIFMELNKSSSDASAEELIKLSKHLTYINSATNQLKIEHSDLITYIRELREIWNAEVSNLHVIKDELVKSWQSKETPNEFFLAINTQFNAFNSTPGNVGLKQTFNFVKTLEKLTLLQYNLTPSIKVISDLLFSVQKIGTTYMMFHYYRLEIFRKFRDYNKGLTKSIVAVDGLIEKLKKSPHVSWKGIVSY